MHREGVSEGVREGRQGGGGGACVKRARVLVIARKGL